MILFKLGGIDMAYLHEFGEDCRYSKEDNLVDVVQDVGLGYSVEQDNYISNLKSNNDTECLKYLHPDMSLEKFEIIHQCCKLGEEYVEQLLSANLDDSTSEIVLYGYVKEINVIREAQEGESLDNLKMLIDLLSQGFDNLSEIFDENMEYIDYAKVKEKLDTKK